MLFVVHSPPLLIMAYSVAFSDCSNHENIVPIVMAFSKVENQCNYLKRPGDGQDVNQNVGVCGGGGGGGRTCELKHNPVWSRRYF